MRATLPSRIVQTGAPVKLTSASVPFGRAWSRVSTTTRPSPASITSSTPSVVAVPRRQPVQPRGPEAVQPEVGGASDILADEHALEIQAVDLLGAVREPDERHDPAVSTNAV